MLPPGAAVDLTLGKAQFCLPYVCLKKRKEKKRGGIYGETVTSDGLTFGFRYPTVW